MATAEFSKFASKLNAALSQHHLLGFEIVQLELIPLPPLVLFVVMLPKAHLTSHSRMSGSRWVITSSWLMRREDLFCTVLCILATSSSYLLLLFGPYRLSFIEPIFAWNVPLVSLIFLKRSLFFPILLFSSISLHWSLRKSLLCLLAILWNSTFKRGQWEYIIITYYW